MTTQPGPEPDARDVPTNRPGQPLEYAAPSVRTGRHAPLGSITAFAEGTFLTSLLLLAALIVGDRAVSGTAPGAACATIGATLSATVIGSVALFVTLKLRERRMGEPLQPRSTLALFVTGMLNMAVAGTLWYVMWRLAWFTPHNVLTACAWLIPLLIVPVVSPLWLVRRPK